MSATVPHFPPRETGTCSVWALGMLLAHGGRTKFIRSSHYRWLFRVLWTPDRKEWFGYVPAHPIPRLARDARWYQRCVHNLHVFKHSLWYEGRVRQEKTHAEVPRH